MPKSRGRKGARKSPKVARFSKPGQRNVVELTDGAGRTNPMTMKQMREWAPTPRRAMVGGSIVKGKRFRPATDGFRRTIPSGPPDEAWTNAWYTYKENKDKGWRYCEGVAKLEAGLMTTAWVIDHLGNVIECTPGINAEWYQGFVIDEGNAMMNPNDMPWDENVPRPTMAQRGTDEFLDGERQLESVSRLTGEGWLGSMMETAIAAMKDAYDVEYAAGVFHVIENITDHEATERFGQVTPSLLEDDAEMKEVADVYPAMEPEVDYQNGNRPPKNL